MDEEDIARLQIPVNDTGAVRCDHRAGDFDGNAQRLVDLQRALGESCRQRLAVEQLHDEVRRARLFANIIQGANVRVRELRNRAGFRSNRSRNSGSHASVGGRILSATVRFRRLSLAL